MTNWDYLLELARDDDKEAFEKMSTLLKKYGPALVEALRDYDALMENLWKAVPWGKTFDLDVTALNKVPLRAKKLLAQLDREALEACGYLPVRKKGKS